MVKIKRGTNSVLVYDEEKLRGITFPSNATVDIKQYIDELMKICGSEEIQSGLLVIPLIFDPFYKVSYKPIKEFLEDKEGVTCLEDDQQAKDLYEFYFQHALPQLSPEGVEYIYVGKEYHSKMDITIAR